MKRNRMHLFEGTSEYFRLWDSIKDVFYTLGGLLGFVLARFMYLHVPTMLAEIAPGEAYWFRRGIYKAGMLVHPGASSHPVSSPSSSSSPPSDTRLSSSTEFRVTSLSFSYSSVWPRHLSLPVARLGRDGQSDMDDAIGPLVLVMATLGWVNIKRLQIDQHRKWMLRTWFYASSIITASGTGDKVWSCDEILYTIDNNSTRLMEMFPACSSGSLESVHVAVSAVWTEAINIGSALRLTFGPSLWIASLVHAIGVEIYIHLTPVKLPDCEKFRIKNNRRGA
ncbi:hypothetical protein RHS01_00302 [Rhizoctonia solani]|uniref:Uncharacterized protein n=1 Tax=Rhizoctonia solani TaxID=456999 RepID=A0A8H7IKV6_9AGAM|nr:hypothetical protein RHS01_00302 [Rhizoctonia solani]